MDIKEIKLLAQLLEKSGLSVLEVCEGDRKIRLEKNIQPAFAPAVYSTPQQMPQSAPSIDEAADAPSAIDFNQLTEVKAPMVGVFYAASAPDAKPFVKRGDKVKKGDVLCVIEAMKLLNEIVAEVDGEIADICVQNGQVVEFSQTLFKLF